MAVNVSKTGKGILLTDMADVLAKNLTALPVEQRLRHLLSLFGNKVVMTSSFGLTSAVLMHLISQITPNAIVLTVRHGYETRQTVEFAQHCCDKFSVQLQVVYAPHLPIPVPGSEKFDAFQQATKVARNFSITPGITTFSR